MRKAMIWGSLLLVALWCVPMADAQSVQFRGRGWGVSVGPGYVWGGPGYYYPRAYYGSYYSPQYYGYYPYPRYYSYPSTWYQPTYTVEPTYRSYYPPATDVLRSRIDVRVPQPDAEVWMEGQLMRQQGLNRTFESPPLTAGTTYRYSIRARWMANGQVMDQTRYVDFQPGDNVTVDFTR